MRAGRVTTCRVRSGRGEGSSRGQVGVKVSRCEVR